MHFLRISHIHSSDPEVVSVPCINNPVSFLLRPQEYNQITIPIAPYDSLNPIHPPAQMYKSNLFQDF